MTPSPSPMSLSERVREEASQWHLVADDYLKEHHCDIFDLRAVAREAADELDRLTKENEFLNQRHSVISADIGVLSHYMQENQSLQSELTLLKAEVVKVGGEVSFHATSGFNCIDCGKSQCDEKQNTHHKGCCVEVLAKLVLRCLPVGA